MRISAFALCLVAGFAPGCLIRAEPPDFVEQCVDARIGDLVGESIATFQSVPSSLTYDQCGKYSLGGLEDYVFEWVAPRSGEYEFSLGRWENVIISVTTPACGGEVDVCNIDEDALVPFARIPRVVYQAEAGDVLHIAVAYESHAYDESFELSIFEAGPNGFECHYRDDGLCDEPEGSGLCDDGTDPEDCN